MIGASASGAAGPIVELRGVDFAYRRGVPVLQAVSLAVSRGEVIGIAGVNGAGKTTLASVLAGLARPSAGTVLLDGVDDTVAGHRLAATVGLVFQDPRTQLFARTVADEIAFGPRNLGVPPTEARTRVAEEARRLGLEDALDRSPFDLPAPMRRLVALAGVLAMRPRVVVLDEPSAGQDVRAWSTTASRIRSLAAEGRAVVVISHDLRLLAAVATRVVVLHRGRVASDGDATERLCDQDGLAAAGLVATQAARLTAAVPWIAGGIALADVGELVERIRAGDGPSRAPGPAARSVPTDGLDG